MASIGEQSEYTMGGVPVKFPCKPYRTQVAMMSKVSVAGGAARSIYGLSRAIYFL